MPIDPNAFTDRPLSRAQITAADFAPKQQVTGQVTGLESALSAQRIAREGQGMGYRTEGPLADDLYSADRSASAWGLTLPDEIRKDLGDPIMPVRPLPRREDWMPDVMQGLLGIKSTSDRRVTDEYGIDLAKVRTDLTKARLDKWVVTFKMMNNRAPSITEMQRSQAEIKQQSAEDVARWRAAERNIRVPFIDVDPESTTDELTEWAQKYGILGAAAANAVAWAKPYYDESAIYQPGKEDTLAPSITRQGPLATLAWLGRAAPSTVLATTLAASGAFDTPLTDEERAATVGIPVLGVMGVAAGRADLDAFGSRKQIELIREGKDLLSYSSEIGDWMPYYQATDAMGLWDEGGTADRWLGAVFGGNIDTKALVRTVGGAAFGLGVALLEPDAISVSTAGLGKVARVGKALKGAYQASKSSVKISALAKAEATALELESRISGTAESVKVLSELKHADPLVGKAVEYGVQSLLATNRPVTRETLRASRALVAQEARVGEALNGAERARRAAALREDMSRAEIEMAYDQATNLAKRAAADGEKAAEEAGRVLAERVAKLRETDDLIASTRAEYVVAQVRAQAAAQEARTGARQAQAMEARLARAPADKQAEVLDAEMVAARARLVRLRAQGLDTALSPEARGLVDTLAGWVRRRQDMTTAAREGTNLRLLPLDERITALEARMSVATAAEKASAAREIRDLAQAALTRGMRAARQHKEQVTAEVREALNALKAIQQGMTREVDPLITLRYARQLVAWREAVDTRTDAETVLRLARSSVPALRKRLDKHMDRVLIGAASSLRAMPGVARRAWDEIVASRARGYRDLTPEQLLAREQELARWVLFRPEELVPLKRRMIKAMRQDPARMAAMLSNKAMVPPTSETVISLQRGLTRQAEQLAADTARRAGALGHTLSAREAARRWSAQALGAARRAKIQAREAADLARAGVGRAERAQADAPRLMGRPRGAVPVLHAPRFRFQTVMLPVGKSTRNLGPELQEEATALRKALRDPGKLSGAALAKAQARLTEIDDMARAMSRPMADIPEETVAELRRIQSQVAQQELRTAQVAHYLAAQRFRDMIALSAVMRRFGLLSANKGGDAAGLASEMSDYAADLNQARKGWDEIFAAGDLDAFEAHAEMLAESQRRMLEVGAKIIDTDIAAATQRLNNMRREAAQELENAERLLADLTGAIRKAQVPGLVEEMAGGGTLLDKLLARHDETLARIGEGKEAQMGTLLTRALFVSARKVRESYEALAAAQRAPDIGKMADEAALASSIESRRYWLDFVPEAAEGWARLVDRFVKAPWVNAARRTLDTFTDPAREILGPGSERVVQIGKGLLDGQRAAQKELLDVLSRTPVADRAGAIVDWVAGKTPGTFVNALSHNENLWTEAWGFMQAIPEKDLADNPLVQAIARAWLPRGEEAGDYAARLHTAVVRMIRQPLEEGEVAPGFLDFMDMVADQTVALSALPRAAVWDQDPVRALGYAALAVASLAQLQRASRALTKELAGISPEALDAAGRLQQGLPGAAGPHMFEGFLALAKLGVPPKTRTIASLGTDIQTSLLRVEGADGLNALVPRQWMAATIERMGSIVKQTEEYRAGEIFPAHRYVKRAVNAYFRVYNTSLTTGLLLGNVAHFANMMVGNLAQVWLDHSFVAAARATGLTAGSAAVATGRWASQSLASRVPVFGTMLDRAVEFQQRATRSKWPLAGPINAMLNPDLARFFDSAAPGGRAQDLVTGAAQSVKMGELRRAAIQEGVVGTMASTNLIDVLRRTGLESAGSIGTFARASEGIGAWTAQWAHMADWLEGRMRVALFSDLVLNQGLTYTAAGKVVRNALYDWGYAGVKHEMEMAHGILMFWRMWRLALGQGMRAIASPWLRAYETPGALGGMLSASGMGNATALARGRQQMETVRALQEMGRSQVPADLNGDGLVDETDQELAWLNEVYPWWAGESAKPWLVNLPIGPSSPDAEFFRASIGAAGAPTAALKGKALANAQAKAEEARREAVPTHIAYTMPALTPLDTISMLSGVIGSLAGAAALAGRGEISRAATASIGSGFDAVAAHSAPWAKEAIQGLRQTLLADRDSYLSANGLKLRQGEMWALGVGPDSRYVVGNSPSWPVMAGFVWHDDRDPEGIWRVHPGAAMVMRTLPIVGPELTRWVDPLLSDPVDRRGITGAIGLLLRQYSGIGKEYAHNPAAQLAGVEKRVEATATRSVQAHRLPEFSAPDMAPGPGGSGGVAQPFVLPSMRKPPR